MIKDNQKTINHLFIIIDAILIVGAYFLAYPLRFRVLSSFGPFALQKGEGFLKFSEYAQNIIFLLPGYLIIYNMCGLYKPKRGHSRIRVIGNLLEANVLGIFYFAFIIFVMKKSDISRSFYGIFGALNLTFGLGLRLVSGKILRAFRKKGKNLKHVLLVGYSRAAEGFIDRVKQNPEWGYWIHGILDDNLVLDTDYKGVKVTGATVHFVDSGTDTGPIILQKAVSIEPDDTPESLQLRVMQQAEWKLLPEAVRLFSEGKLNVEGKICRITAGNE